MNHNSGNKTIIYGVEGLSKFEDKSHIDKAYEYSRRQYKITDVVNNRVTLLLGQGINLPTKKERTINKFGYSIKLEGADIIAPKGTKIIIIGGNHYGNISFPENDVKIYKAGKIVTRGNKGKLHIKNSGDVTAHKNNEVVLSGNNQAYAKWNNKVTARNNGELMVFYNEEVILGEGNKDINPGIHGGPEGVEGYNGKGKSAFSGM